MKDKKNQILEYLYQYGPAKAKTISDKLDISLRSVQRYIHEWNETYKDLIRTDNAFYSINQEQYKKLQESQIDYSRSKRIQQIMVKLIRSHDCLNIEDLCDEFFVSTSTMRKDIIEIKQHVKPFGITVNINADNIYVEAEDKSRRQLIKENLYAEMNENFIDMHLVQNYFPDFDVEAIKKIITQEFTSKQFYIDEYYLDNLLLHLIIKLYCLTDETEIRYWEASNVFEEMSDHICSAIEDLYHIYFDSAERKDLSWLIYSYIQKNHQEIDIKEDNLIPADIYHTLGNIINEIDQIYGIDLRKHDLNFLDNFALHIKNLLFRSSHGIVIKNPITGSIKANYPLLYEVSVMITNRLQEVYTISLNEDEITYIALHIGSQVDSIKSLTTKLNCILICPEFYALSKKLLSTLKSRYSEEIVITDILTDSKLLKYKPCDLIISTINLPLETSQNSIKIDYILTREMSLELDKCIHQTLKKKNAARLKYNISKLLSKEHFFIIDDGLNQEEIIHLMGDKLFSSGYVEESFTNDCLSREVISPTAYNTIAIPHPITLNAKQSIISIAIAKKQIVWHNHKKIRLVLMLAIEKKDLPMFKPIFEFISYYINGELNIQNILNANNFEEFKTAFLSCLD